MYEKYVTISNGNCVYIFLNVYIFLDPDWVWQLLYSIYVRVTVSFNYLQYNWPFFKHTYSYVYLLIPQCLSTIWSACKLCRTLFFPEHILQKSMVLQSCKKWPIETTTIKLNKKPKETETKGATYWYTISTQFILIYILATFAYRTNIHITLTFPNLT